ncbi:Gfo/Idh/MocA family oxidoreductase [Kitasatospora arboriphila]
MSTQHGQGHAPAQEAHEAPGEHVPTPGTTGSAPGRRIGLAVVGAGYWGPNLVRNAQQTAALRLHWLCDLDEERSRRVLGEYSTVRTTTSFDEVLADDRVEAVAVATPAAAHYKLVRAALEAAATCSSRSPSPPPPTRPRNCANSLKNADWC